MNDERPEVKELLLRLKTELPNLATIKVNVEGQWGYEDEVYRFYHQSFKVYALQESTKRIVTALQALAPDRPLHPWFLQIVAEGTGKQFELAHNGRWLQETRPILEAFFHARYFLDMAIKYAPLDDAPSILPTGWAAFLYLFNLR